MSQYSLQARICLEILTGLTIATEFRQTDTKARSHFISLYQADLEPRCDLQQDLGLRGRVNVMLVFYVVKGELEGGLQKKAANQQCKHRCVCNKAVPFPFYSLFRWKIR